MIKILTLVMLLMAGNAFAEEPSPFDGRHEVKPIVYTECKGGQLFIIAASQYGVAIMQIFKDEGDMIPKPIECPCLLKDENNDSDN